MGNVSEIRIHEALEILVWAVNAECREIHVFRPNGAMGGNEEGEIYASRRVYGVSHERAVAEALLMASQYMIKQEA